MTDLDALVRDPFDVWWKDCEIAWADTPEQFARAGWEAALDQQGAAVTRQVIEVDGERFGVPPHLAKRIVDALAQQGEPVAWLIEEWLERSKQIEDYGIKGALVCCANELKHALAHPALSAPQDGWQPVDDFIRDVCETDPAADGSPDVVMIRVHDLRLIAQRHFPTAPRGEGGGE